MSVHPEVELKQVEQHSEASIASRTVKDAPERPWNMLCFDDLADLSEDHCNRSVGLFSRDNFFRKACFKVTSSRWFDNAVLFFIALNAIMLALVSYELRCVDGRGNPTNTCIQNKIVEQSEGVFFAVFALEMVLKVLTFGFLFEGPKTYLKDPMCILDCVVVCSSVAAFVSPVNVSVLRIFRLIRPLKSLSKFPKLRRLISALIQSLPSLANVVVLLIFVLLLFSILGVQFFQGYGHSRCRITEFPIRLNESACDWSQTKAGDDCWYQYMADVVQNHQDRPDDYICRDRAGGILDFKEMQPTLIYLDFVSSKGTAKRNLWKQPLDCFWPVDETDPNSCSMEPKNGGYGMHRCLPVVDILNLTGNSVGPLNRWCGSNYDPFGQPRFDGRKEPYGYSGSRMSGATFNAPLNWGFTTFDHLGDALITIFQAVTMEGWSDIMYIYMDSFNATAAACIFCLLILFGSFFMLNLMLAVITKQIEGTPEEGNSSNETEFTDMTRQTISKSARRHEANMTAMPSWRLRAYKVVIGTTFQRIFFVAILVNTFVLALDRHPSDQGFDQMLSDCNLVLTLVFAAEMAIKLVVLGPTEYMADGYNIFDGMVVCMSILEIALESYLRNAGGFSALRAFRIFRVFKMAKEWHSLQTLLSTMVQSLKEIGNFFLLLCLFIYIYALVGMQFFANKLRFDPDDGHRLKFSNDPSAPVNDPDLTETPLSNFDNLVQALLTIFQVLTGENWNMVMFDTRRAVGPALASVYFVSLVIFGACMVMNIFLAILLSNFEGNEKLAPPETGKGTFVQCQDFLARSAASLGFISCSRLYKIRPEAKQQEKQQEVQSEKEAWKDNGQALEPDRSTTDISNRDRSLGLFGPKTSIRQLATTLVTHPSFDNIIVALIIVSSLLLAIDSPLMSPDSPLARALSILNIIFTIIFTFEAVAKILHLGLIWNGPNSYLRSAWNFLDFSIVAVSIVDITLSGANLSFLRALRTIRVLRPLRMISRQRELKLVVDALLSSFPQIVNVSVVCVLFFFIFAIIGVNCFKGRMEACQGSGWDSLTSSQQSLVVSPPERWSSLSMKEQAWLLNGTGLSEDAAAWTHSCTEEDLNKLVKKRGKSPDIYTSQDVCYCWLGRSHWGAVMPGWNNFDDVFSAMGLLFEISTTEGWADVMQHAVAGTQPFMQPIRGHNIPAVLYFVVFMLFGALFVMQLFVGVIIERFNQIREENQTNGTGGRLLMSEAQHQWAKTMDFIMKSKPYRKITPKCKQAFAVVSHPHFDTFIMLCIVMNAFTMGAQFLGMGPEVGDAIDSINLVFAGVFTMEMVLKVSGFGFSAYVSDNWNCFDFAIVLGTWAGILIKFTLDTDVGSVASIIRLFRIGRMLRLLNSCRTLKHLFNTFITSLPSLTNVGALLMIILFMYSVLGVQLFALYQENEDLNSHAHFQTFWMSMITLFRFSTGENWNGMMHSMSTQRDGCEDSPSYNSNWCTFSSSESSYGCVPLNKCGDSGVLFLYFYTFTLSITLVMLNLFIGIILDAFGETDDENATLSEDNLREFMISWSDFDPDATWHLPIRKLKPFIQTLAEPMGFGVKYEASEQELEAEILSLSLGIRLENIDENSDPGHLRLHIYDVATALAKRVAQRVQGSAFQDLPTCYPTLDRVRDQVEASPYIQSHFEESTHVRSGEVTEIMKYDTEGESEKQSDDDYSHSTEEDEGSII